MHSHARNETDRLSTILITNLLQRDVPLSSAVGELVFPFPFRKTRSEILTAIPTDVSFRLVLYRSRWLYEKMSYTKGHW